MQYTMIHYIRKIHLHSGWHSFKFKAFSDSGSRFSLPRQIFQQFAVSLSYSDETRTSGNVPIMPRLRTTQSGPGPGDSSRQRRLDVGPQAVSERPQPETYKVGFPKFDHGMWAARGRPFRNRILMADSLSNSPCPLGCARARPI